MKQGALLSPARAASGPTDGERLLVWALRRLAVRPDMGRVMISEFAKVCAEDPAEVLATLRVFIAALGTAAGRRIGFAQPGSCGLTADERQIVAVIAAAQQGEVARVEALLCWLARNRAHDQLALAARALAAIFEANGLRFAAAPARRPAPSASTPLRLV